MPPERRRLGLLLSVLAAVSLIAVYQYWPAEAPAGVSGRPAGGVAARPAAGTGVSAPDVRLHALDAERPTPDETTYRDLFRFQERRVPASSAPSRPSSGGAAPPVAQPGPPAAPSLPPIAMRFIGLVEAPEQAQKIAILSDGRGIYQGREGDIIEGRYRILRIGPESLDMAYLDGRGRQTIRLSGS
jgi:hypothetical protein